MDAIFDGAVDLIVSAVEWVTDVLLSVFPDSPFDQLELALEGSGVMQGLAWLNWLLPIGEMLSIFALWLVAAAVYMAVQWVLGVIQSIRG